MGCICGSFFAILVNGFLAKWFSFILGLHQGWLLSSYMFILDFEVLSRSLQKEQCSGNLMGANLKCVAFNSK